MIINSVLCVEKNIMIKGHGHNHEYEIMTHNSIFVFLKTSKKKYLKIKETKVTQKKCSNFCC